MADNDPSYGYPDSKADPATRHTQITAHASNPLDPIPRAIYCQVAGTITIVDKYGTSLPYAMTVGQVLPFRGRLVTSVGSGTFYAWGD